MIFIAGGTGFIGQHLLRALKEKDYKIRCLARSHERAEACKRKGFDAVIGDITERDSLKNTLDGVDMVVNLVGIIEEKNDMTFEKVHVEGTRNLVDEAKKAEVKHFFYQSALGASLSSWSKYHKTKAEAEEIVRTSGVPYTIFRPSIVVGHGDGFTERIRELLKVGPFVPVPGTGNAKLQPIYVEDWVRCFLKIIDNPEAISKVYEFGGPEHLTYNKMVKVIMDTLEIKKPILHIPMGIAKMGLPFMSGIGRIAGIFGKKIPAATSEQLGLLAIDNICEPDSVKKNFGFEPLSFNKAIKRFIKK